MMKLQDIADMKDYLENRCYCPYEIYDLTGFFYQLFRPETDCLLLAVKRKEELVEKFVIAKSTDDAEEQIIYIEIKDNRVESCARFDATTHNKREVVEFVKGEIDKMTLDEYKDGATKEALNEIMSVADAVIV